MSKTYRTRNQYNRRQRRISVRAIRRAPPDVRRLGRALTKQAITEAEAEAAAQRQVEAAEHQHSQLTGLQKDNDA